MTVITKLKAALAALEAMHSLDAADHQRFEDDPDVSLEVRMCRTSIADLRSVIAELEATQNDAERYRWLKNRIEVRKQAAVNGSVRDSISVRIGYAFIDATTRTFPKEYEVEISAKLDQAVDAAIKAKGDAK